jgi:hypothetical protein
MSGGSLNYFYYKLEEHVGDFGDKELDELVKDLAKLFHDREWYLSADYGKGSWIEARDEFKAKWFTEHGRQERIEKYLAEIGDDVRAMFGMSNDRCQNCKHWAKVSDHYGKCDFKTGCLSHRSESCEKYEKGVTE